MKREAISKKLRFEVFKRDSFKCQYCGRSAPDVLLQADHVKPVAAGGETSIINLITSCAACNAGKGARELDDSTALMKQKAQLDELQERREQIEMMVEWMEGLREIKNDLLVKVCEIWDQKTPGWTMNDEGQKCIKRLLKDFSPDEVMSAMEEAEMSLKYTEEGLVTKESWVEAFDKISLFCKMTRLRSEDPVTADLLYTRGILKNRIYLNEFQFRSSLKIMRSAIARGVTVQQLRDAVFSSVSFRDFEEEVERI